MERTSNAARQDGSTFKQGKLFLREPLGPLTIRKVVLEGRDSQSFSINDEACLGTTLTTGKLCSVHIRFAGDESRPYHAQLTIWDNAPGGPRVVTLSGKVEG